MRLLASAIVSALLVPAACLADGTTARSALIGDGKTPATVRCQGCDLAAVWLQNGTLAQGSDLSGAGAGLGLVQT